MKSFSLSAYTVGVQDQLRSLGHFVPDAPKTNRTLSRRQVQEVCNNEFVDVDPAWVAEIKSGEISVLGAFDADALRLVQFLVDENHAVLVRSNDDVWVAENSGLLWFAEDVFERLGDGTWASTHPFLYHTFLREGRLSKSWQTTLASQLSEAFGSWGSRHSRR